MSKGSNIGSGSNYSRTCDTSCDEERQQQLNESKEEDNLLNFSGRILKVEPLANISHLEKNIGKMCLKQWHDYKRDQMAFVTQLRQQLADAPFVYFPYETDFDTNGLLYYVGTNGRTQRDWLNPAQHASLLRLSVAESSRTQLAAGKLEDLCGRVAAAVHTQSDDKRVWFALDLGISLVPTHYTLRYSKPASLVATFGSMATSGNSSGRTAPRNWAILGSRTGGSSSADWDLLHVHTNDDALREPGASHTWHLAELSAAVRAELAQNGVGWRFIRIQQTGRNQSGSSAYTLSLCGLELYGRVTAVATDADHLKHVHLSSSSTRVIDSESRRSSRHKKASKFMCSILI